MTSIQYQILRLIKTLGRPVSFTEMVFYIGEDKYERIWREIDTLRDNDAVTQWASAETLYRFVYEATDKGLALYQKYEPDYRGLPFAHPVQKEI